MITTFSLRVAALLDNELDYTNDKYLFKFILRVLFNDTNYGLTVEQLAEEIVQLVPFEYSIREIKECIFKCNKGQINFNNDLYSLNDKGFEEAKSINNQDNFELLKYIEIFFKLNNVDYKLTREQALDIIQRFIYLRFNENIQSINDIFECNNVNKFD